MKKITGLMFVCVLVLVGCGAHGDLSLPPCIPSSDGANAADAMSADAQADGEPDASADVVEERAPGPCSGFYPSDILLCTDCIVNGFSTWNWMYYMGTDCRRYVFPNPTTFSSWYQDHAPTQAVTSSVLRTIDIAGNVTIRPGTYLVMLRTDPRIYAVTRCGVLHELRNGLEGLLYSSVYMSDRVRIVHDAFFVNYSIGSPIENPEHPDGTLINYAGSPDVYVIERGRRRPISLEAFEANRFQRQFIITTDIVYPDGPPVTGYEAALSETVCAP